MRRTTHLVGVTILVAFAALALTTPASAEHEEPITNHEEPLEIDDENSVHCDDISDPPVDEEPETGGSEATGGCPFGVGGEVRLFGHLFGFETTVSDCVVAGSGQIDEEGEGWIIEKSLSDHTGLNDCTTIPCTEANHMMRAFPFHIREDTGDMGTQEWIAMEICVTNDDGSNRRECEIEFPITAVGHNYSINAESQGSNHLNMPNCEVDGAGTVASQQVELEHDHLP